jgi:hypothetical protein
VTSKFSDVQDPGLQELSNSVFGFATQSKAENTRIKYRRLRLPTLAEMGYELS